MYDENEIKRDGEKKEYGLFSWQIKNKFKIK
jgi:hypothetical protein